MTKQPELVTQEMTDVKRATWGGPADSEEALPRRLEGNVWMQSTVWRWSANKLQDACKRLSLSVLCPPAGPLIARASPPRATPRRLPNRAAPSLTCWDALWRLTKTEGRPTGKSQIRNSTKCSFCGDLSPEKR